MTDDVVTDCVHFIIHETSATIEYETGEAILDTARRGLLNPPFRCRRGRCGTCKALLERGTAVMRENNYLTKVDIKDGWVLTCQAIPTSNQLSVNYDAHRLLPGLRFLGRTLRNLFTWSHAQD
jgi:ring-1,2-phenylacetyl-CoA epoxidase subunit PaaE